MASSTTCSANNRNDQLANPFWRVAQPQRDHLRFLLAIQPFLARWGRRFFTVQSALKAYGHEALPDIFYRFRPTRKGLGNFLVCPVGTIRIGLEEHVGPPHLLRRPLQFLNHPA